jgi:NitT/TauT family transport system substrate-binding protein
VQIIQNRRRFLTGLSAAGAAGFIGAPTPGLAEPPPETTAVRLAAYYKISDCMTPQYIAKDLLAAEGFSDVVFVDKGTGLDGTDWLANGEIDFDWNFPPAHLRSLDAGTPIKVLCGLHTGCNELVAAEDINSVAALKGKRVGIDVTNGAPHAFLVMMAAYVGLDPFKDIRWVANATDNPVDLLANGEIDAFLNAPPLPQQARERKIGHTILDMGIDRPWAQYFCCMLSSSAEFMQRNPVATKRVMRAILKSIDLCVSDPERMARLAVERGFAERYDFALEAIKTIGYDSWRSYAPEDALRFYGLRMKETGLIKSAPETLIAKGTEWRFLHELKRELRS